jgi:HK97 family phage portal protein
MQFLGRLARALTQSMRPPAAEERSGSPFASEAWFSGVRGGAWGAEAVLSNLSVAARAVALRSELLAAVPLSVYRRLSGGGRERVDDHALTRLLDDQPNPRQSAFEARELLIRSLDLHGNAYGRIERDAGGQVAAIWPAAPLWVTVETLPTGRMRYRVAAPDEPTTWTLLEGAGEVVHVRAASVDGRMGRSPLDVARGSLALALSQTRAAQALMDNSLRPSIMLNHPAKLSDKAFQNLRESLQERNAGAGNAGRPLILEEGMKADIASFTPSDAEFLGHRQISNEDVARVFGIPPAVLGIGDRPTYGSAVEESRQLVTGCLAPLAARLEAALARDLLTAEERRAGFFIRHDLEGLLRGDLKTRFEAYRIGREIGVWSPNDIRRRENEAPIDAGDEYLRPLNMAPLGTPPPANPLPNDGRPT